MITVNLFDGKIFYIIKKTLVLIFSARFGLQSDYVALFDICVELAQTQ